MAPLFVVAVAAALALHVARTRALPPVPIRLTVAILAFSAFAALSATWSVAPEQTLRTIVPVTGLLLGGAVMLGLAANLDDSGRTAVRAAVIGGSAVGGALVFGEWIFGRPILAAYHIAIGRPMTHYPLMMTFKTTSSVLALFAWPWLLAMRQRFSRVAALAAGGGLIALIVALKATSPLLALALGVAVFFVARRFERIMTPLLGIALVVGVLAAPWIPAWLPSPQLESRKMEFLSNSAIHRIQIWKTTATHIQSKFWLGHGFDTARMLYPASARHEETYRQDDPQKTFKTNFEPIPLHPHNLILQIWLETGLVGALLVLAALGAALAALARATLEKSERAAGYAFFVTALAIGSASFGAWQAWWLSTILLNAALMIATFSRSPTGSH